MDIVTIIAEYNPLHNGHLYHIQKTKEQFPTSHIVVVMSGDFVMRAQPAVLSKYERATHAIKAGADAVIELPSFTSFLHGEGFARSAINVAKFIRTSTLSFGSECGDINKLISLNTILESPSEEYKRLFDKKMKEGKSYPRATYESMRQLYPDSSYELLNSPNNNLALMYLRWLKDTDIVPYTVKRTDYGYDATLPKNGFLSATGIRQLLDDGKVQDVSNFVPDYVFNSLKNSYRNCQDAFSTLVLYKFVNMQKEDVKNLYDVGEGLENRIKKYAPVCRNLQHFLQLVKCKRYTLSRLRRICAYALFDVTKDKVEKTLNSKYASLIAIKRDRVELISHLKQSGIVTCYSDLNDATRPLWEAEKIITDTRNLLYGDVKNTRNTLFI